MNIHLPAILMFTRSTRFWPTAISGCPVFHLRRLTFYKKWTTCSPGVSANAESASLWPEAWSSWNWCHRYPQTPVWIKESTRVNMNEENLCVDSVGQNFPDLTWRHDMSPCQDVRCMLVRLVMVHVQGPPYQQPSLGWKHTHTHIYICLYIYSIFETTGQPGTYFWRSNCVISSQQDLVPSDQFHFSILSCQHI